MAHHNHNNTNNHYRKYKNKFHIYDSELAELAIHPYSAHDLAFPQFHRPIEIGSMISEARAAKLNLKPNAINAGQVGYKYLVLPKDMQNVRFDLNVGYKSFQEHKKLVGIDTLLQWILANQEKLRIARPASENGSSPKKPKTKLFKADFVCWRGLLTVILATPYEKNRDWRFTIIKHKGTIYLCECETELNKASSENMDEKQKILMYWGHKFETFLVIDSPSCDEITDVCETPDTEDYFATVVSARLGNHSLLYAAEIDCCIGKEHSALSDYCEIKTSLGHSFADLCFDRQQKFLKWWLQCYLVDIQRLFVGMRDDAGLVSSVVECTTTQIYKGNNSARWKGNVCFNFLKSLLDLISEFCMEEDQVYVAERTLSNNSVRISKLSSKSDNYAENFFLRDWFLKEI